MKKQISAAVMIFAMIAAPSMAQSMDKQAFETQVFEVQPDKPLQLAELSKQEMKETEGAVAPWVVGGAIGGLAGGAGYAWGAYRGHYKWDNAKFAGNVASGAVIGGSFGTAGAIASGGAKFIPSLTNAGANVWRVNSAIANNGANRVWRR
ncbi:class IIb bacteriocin, lactobin A/cerein 7B family [Neisseria yangbaofengii]|uniref:class IIb bacteriocin, lactobin A/cerein 7B family n=1 Tax=Neisseria yangbaofengii TaxID=2709396 RepID=UPI0013EB5793|nr:class IIb bacteriocin, lactobin A/cerein 7B family [Neisseria yangbaofengii]